MFTLTSLQAYFDSLYSKNLHELHIAGIDLETEEEFTKLLLSCMGRDIVLHNRPAYQKAAQWFFRLVSEDFYKCQLNHCDSNCLCRRSRSGVNAYWRFFDIAEHPKYSALEFKVRRELLQRETGVILTDGGHAELVELARDGHSEAIQRVSEIVSGYLIDQLIADCAYYETCKYQNDKFNLSEDEFNTLINIATRRHERGQPITEELQAFLIYNFRVNRLQSGGKRRNTNEPSQQQRNIPPSIGDGSIDYRIMFMLKDKTERAGLSFAELASAKPKGFNAKVDEVCQKINDWGYFKTVSPTASGSSKANAISSVRSRYFAKYPV